MRKWCGFYLTVLFVSLYWIFRVGVDGLTVECPWCTSSFEISTPARNVIWRNFEFYFYVFLPKPVAIKMLFVMSVKIVFKKLCFMSNGKVVEPLWRLPKEFFLFFWIVAIRSTNAHILFEASNLRSLFKCIFRHTLQYLPWNIFSDIQLSGN